MTLTSHLAELEEKHRTVDEMLGRAMASPGSDDSEIRKLKQEKLRLKDEMERLRKATRH